MDASRLTWVTSNKLVEEFPSACGPAERMKVLVILSEAKDLQFRSAAS
jgi:hypothetical protein